MLQRRWPPPFKIGYCSLYLRFHSTGHRYHPSLALSALLVLKADVTAVPVIATRMDSLPNLLCITWALSLKSVADPLGLLSLTHIPCSNWRQLWECKEVTFLDICVVNGICFSPVIFRLPSQKGKRIRFWETPNDKCSQILSTYKLTSACIRFSWRDTKLTEVITPTGLYGQNENNKC